MATQHVKAIAQQLIRRTANNRLAWSVYKHTPARSYAGFVRYSAYRDALIARAMERYPDLKVARGPFQGLRYPWAIAKCSELMPKLIGSYESELHATLNELLCNNYDSVVDIGCAEGYYAVGLALRLPETHVYAFDTDQDAVLLCAEMAALNGLSDRVHVRGFCDQETLRSLPLGSRALIISDCEGFEGTLFTRRLAESFVRHDLIIETHDFIQSDISERMRDAFIETHSICSIKSMADSEKERACQFAELAHFTSEDKRIIVRETRPGTMEWLVMRRL